MKTRHTIKSILGVIENKKQNFSQLPFFSFLKDQQIDPRQRLSFAPCLSPLVMGFSELCQSVLREEPTHNKIQELINQHTYEEENHWQWLLEDIQKLELDELLRFTDALRFMWGEETQKTRKVCQRMERYSFQSDPLQKLIVMEVAEATAHVFFSRTEPVIQEFQEVTKKQYRYFGGHHIDMEEKHNIKTHDVVDLLEDIELTEEQYQAFLAIVDELFEVFSDSMSELLVYATKHAIDPQLQAA